MRSSHYCLALALIALTGIVAAEAPAGSCADYFQQATMHGGRAAGDNHPHALEYSLTNYEAMCGTSSGPAATVQVQNTCTNACGFGEAQDAWPTCTCRNRVMKCASSCPSDMLQNTYPGCGCYEKQMACTNACSDGESQDAWPTCTCRTQELAGIDRICDDTCQRGWTQSAYPDCVCKKPASTAVCANTCASGQVGKPFPDCRCVTPVAETPLVTGRPGDNRPHN